MSFLDWIADWAEKHIPLVGEWIAELVRKIQGAIESAWGWIEKAVAWIENVWIPWAEDLFNSITLSISEIWLEIKLNIESAIDWLKGKVSEIAEKLENVISELENLISNFPSLVWDAIPDWLKDGVRNALDEINNIWNSLNSLWDSFTSWLDNAGSWFQEQLHNAKSTIESWIDDVVDPIRKWVNDFKREFSEFLADPISYIRNIMSPVIQDITRAFNELSSWVKEKVHSFTDAILSIDDYIANALEGFIIGLIKWFVATLVDDLAHLQYDPETKQIYGEPKNPLTHILVWFFEIEKPENPYRSVKDQMDVKEVRGD
jgi:phage-related protein